MPVRWRAARPRLAATAAVIAASMLAAACGSASSPSAGSAAVASSGASGTLNWEWELPTSWDPVTSTAGWDVHVLGLVYASLTTLTPSGNVGPGLASSWKYAGNGKSVTFTLRPGLKFSDGTALNAQAVQANIERGLKQSNSTIASELAVISKVVVNSPTSFTLDLSQVDYQMPDLLAGKDGMMVSPAAFKHPGNVPTHPVGAGPFKLTSYVPDSHADLVRNPGYWDASQIHIANSTVQDITEPEQILAAGVPGVVVEMLLTAEVRCRARVAAGDHVPARPAAADQVQAGQPPGHVERVVVRRGHGRDQAEVGRADREGGQQGDGLQPVEVVRRRVSGDELAVHDEDQIELGRLRLPGQCDVPVDVHAGIDRGVLVQPQVRRAGAAHAVTDGAELELPGAGGGHACTAVAGAFSVSRRATSSRTSGSSWRP